ncbi:BAALC binder of MAP3K1 and KLF4 a [Brachyhypopomus gauderio]|uniref:BAALC binder of MAP3K1 and KLF4 a n=1 Tax=Brachyhypopomus gauderio TaxID=698409 RepID=UPI0040430609
MRMVLFMGCGGSRSDAVDPRWHDSWTGETESTWLTTTDTEATQTAVGSHGHQSGTGEPRGGAGRRENTATCTALGVSTCNGEEKASCATKGSGGKERKLVNAGTQCGRQTFHCQLTNNDLQKPTTQEGKNKSRKTSSGKAVKNAGQDMNKRKIP